MTQCRHHVRNTGRNSSGPVSQGALHNLILYRHQVANGATPILGIMPTLGLHIIKWKIIEQQYLHELQSRIDQAVINPTVQINMRKLAFGHIIDDPERVIGLRLFNSFEVNALGIAIILATETRNINDL